MKNYSQNNEQEVILNYFKGRVGTFCDIGANDGVTFSNTYALLLNGWRGVSIEASPRAFEKLKENTKQFVESKQLFLRNFALGKTEMGLGSKYMTLYESGSLVSKEDVALVSTFHHNEMNRFRSTVDYTPIRVKVLPWGEIEYDCQNDLPDNEKNQTIFDFISMDIEGSELEVLPQMDLTDVKMFCIEWNGKHALKNEYEKYFGGFKLIHTTGENLIYAR